jgi:glyoxylate reductase
MVPSEELVRNGEWKQWHPYLPFLGDEVNGKTVAVIGAGRIGRLFADACLALDMDILFHSRSPIGALIESFRSLVGRRRELGFTQRGIRIDAPSFDTCLAEADFISLHVPLTPETRGLFNRESFRRMKSSAYLINTSRGPVVDEVALCEALLQGEIAGAALDVFEVEPLPADSPLLDPRLRDRLRLYHHFGSGGTRTRLSPDPNLGMAGRCVQGVIDVLEGHYGGDPQKIPHVVNRAQLVRP